MTSTNATVGISSGTVLAANVDRRACLEAAAAAGSSHGLDGVFKLA